MFSTSNTRLHKLQNLNSEKKHHFHQSIFSEYLNSNNEGTFIGRLSDPNTKLSPLHYEEIGVFGAGKYFNERVVNTQRGSNKVAKKYGLQNMNYQVQYETPSIRSESSTCNTLRSFLQRKSKKDMKNKVPVKSFLAGLCLKCSCSDMDSVDINSNSSGEISFNKTDSSYGVAHEKTTPKKIFNVGLDGNNNSVKINNPHAEDILMPRKSVQVFGSPIFSSKDIASASRFEGIDFNYAGSDSSSDLFEIESFKEKPNSFFQDIIASSPKSGYAASEGSIEWSVGTGSGAVMSDCEEDQMSEESIRSPIRISFSSSNGKRDIEREQLSKIVLGGCKSHVAVRVASDAFFITYEKPSSTSKVQHHSTNISQLPRFTDGRNGQKHPYSSTPHPPNASTVLYI